MKMKIIGIIVTLLILTSGAFYIRGVDYSTGFRVGTIQKFSTKGFVFKTHEGELILDGITFQNRSVVTNSNVPAMTTVWKFSVTNSKVADELDKVVQSGNTHVMLYYTEHYPNFTVLSNTPYRITKVVAIK